MKAIEEREKHLAGSNSFIKKCDYATEKDLSSI